jgi:glutathione synthase/RimK-type ligase-like ATP-grasp enzyme
VLLIVTNREDLTADWLVLELEARGTPFVRFNTEDFPQAVKVAWSEGADAVLRVRDRELSLRDVDAVWYRRPLPPRVAAVDPEVSSWTRNEAQAALAGLWRTHDAVWVNAPGRNAAAANKLHQLRTARRLGLDVPRTLVSNDPRALVDFAAGQRTGVVCKPLVHGLVSDGTGDHDLVLWTTRLEADDITALAGAGPEPYCLQELVPKQYDVRVTVIGGVAYAARIASQDEPDARVDWRRVPAGRLEHEVEHLPPDVEERCLAVVDAYGLTFGAIDLARRPDGGYVFFELNPNGQWAWVEQRTGLPLRARLADVLTGVA